MNFTISIFDARYDEKNTRYTVDTVMLAIVMNTIRKQTS